MIVKNNTNCDMVYQIYAIDVNSPPGCLDYFSTFATTLPANTLSTTIPILTSFTWMGSAPIPTGFKCNAIVVNFDPSSSCFTPTGYLIGSSACGYSPTQTLPACGCNTNPVNILWSQMTATDWELTIY